MSINPMKDYAGAFSAAYSALAAFGETGDEAYAFRAYIAWRVALGLQQAALASIQDPVQLAVLKDKAVGLASDVFRALDQVAPKLAQPRKTSAAKVDRLNVGIVMAQEVTIRRATGATQEEMLVRAAARLDLKRSRIVQHWYQFLAENNITNKAASVMSQMRARKVLLNRAGKTKPPAKTKRVVPKLHPWRE